MFDMFRPLEENVAPSILTMAALCYYVTWVMVVIMVATARVRICRRKECKLRCWAEHQEAVDNCMVRRFIICKRQVRKGEMVGICVTFEKGEK
jgi:hypothetical protein